MNGPTLLSHVANKLGQIRHPIEDNGLKSGDWLALEQMFTRGQRLTRVSRTSCGKLHFRYVVFGGGEARIIIPVCFHRPTPPRSMMRHPPSANASSSGS